MPRMLWVQTHPSERIIGLLGVTPHISECIKKGKNFVLKCRRVKECIHALYHILDYMTRRGSNAIEFQNEVAILTVAFLNNCIDRVTGVKKDWNTCIIDSRCLSNILENPWRWAILHGTSGAWSSHNRWGNV